MSELITDDLKKSELITGQTALTQGPLGTECIYLQVVQIGGRVATLRNHVQMGAHNDYR